MSADKRARRGAVSVQRARRLASHEHRLRIDRDAELGRVRALNDFALTAPQSYSREEILFQAIELLFSHFPGTALVAFFFADGGNGEGWVRTADEWTHGSEVPHALKSAAWMEPLTESVLIARRPENSPLLPLLDWLDAVAEPAEAAARRSPAYRRMDVVLPFGSTELDSPRAIIAFRTATTRRGQSPVGERDRPYLDLLCRHGAGAMEVAALRTALEHRIQDRTRELSSANKQLEASLDRQREAQEQLVQAGKLAAVGTLVAGLSHELNNPIGIILGYVQSLLKRTPEEVPARQAMVAIERQAQRCGKLVRALLDFARQEPGTRTPIQPVALLEKVIELSAGQSRRRDLKLELSPGGHELAPLVVNLQELESALLNLVTNSIDATPTGGTITLSACAIDEASGPAVRLTVRDSGSGIPPEVLSRVFDPFFTTKPPGQGTGLGLSLARQIVESHGGQVRIETEVGAGTAIHLCLPVAANSAALRSAA